MEKCSKEIAQRYMEFLRTLPHSPGIPKLVMSWLKQLADKAFDQGIVYEWLNIEQVYQLSADAKLEDDEGALDFADIEKLFSVMFKRRDRVVLDQYEIWKCEREAESKQGQKQEKPVYSFRLSAENLSLMGKCLKDLQEQEVAVDGGATT